MYKNLSLKLEENIYLETEKILQKIKMPRNRYFNSAIKQYNKIIHRKLLKEKFAEESKLVSEESMKVLKEFESLID